jgi:hypothetical protein
MNMLTGKVKNAQANKGNHDNFRHRRTPIYCLQGDRK